MLAATYGISGERVSQQLADVAGKLVADYWDNNGGDIRAIVDGSLLMDYDDAGVEMQFKSAAAISVTYTLLERCGFERKATLTRMTFRPSTPFPHPMQSMRWVPLPATSAARSYAKSSGR